MRKSTKLNKKIDYFVENMYSLKGLSEEQQKMLIKSYRKYIIKVDQLKKLKKYSNVK